MIGHGDKALWRAVIGQALDDASRPLSKRRHERLDQLRAREWFTHPNQDFEQVCALAEWDASRVRKHAIPIIEQAATRGVVPQPVENANHRPARVSQDCA